MITFKSFLTEAPIDPWDISWKRDAWRIILDRTQIYLPPSLVKKHLIGKVVTSFHSTTIDGLYKLRAIQHTRKTVSSFTKIESPASLFRTFSGDYKDEHSGMDVVAKLQGTLIFPGNSDIGSIPDHKGMRGAGIANLSLFTDFRSEVTNMCLETFREIMGEPATSSYRIEEELNSSISVNAVKRYKLKIIQLYHKMLDEFLNENREEIFNTHYAEEQKHIFYNEYLISNFTIKEVMLICPQKERVDHITEVITKLGQLKFVNKDKWFQIMDQHDYDRYQLKEIILPDLIEFISHIPEKEQW